MQTAVSYSMRLDRPHTHRVSVEMTIPPLSGPVDLALPAWTPGAYKIVDHARNVRSLVAETPSGSPLPVQRIDLHTWRILDGSKGARVRYDVFGNKLMIHQSQIDASHAWLNGQNVWLCIKDRRDLPVTVRFALPEGWKLATPLQELADGSYGAKDYDELCNAPIEAGTFFSRTVEAAGVSWEVIWHDTLTHEVGDPVQLLSHVCDGIRKLAIAAVELFGPAPFDRYVAFFHESEEPGYLNGLEHVSAMAMQGPLHPLTKPDSFFSMVSHEIVHAWNGQRMAPVGLFRGCDYWKAAHTTGLWVVEGVTEYYATLLALRSGVIDATSYYAGLGELVTSYFQTPGRRVTTLEEASFITWNFGDDRWNGAINYYLKGALTALALDAEIRLRTGGRQSLDDVMRALWLRYGYEEAYEPRAVEAIATEIAGSDLGAFFDLWLRSTQDPDFYQVFQRLGLELLTSQTANSGFRAGGKAIDLRIEAVEAFGPAEDAGLQAGDRLIKVGGIQPSEKVISALRTAGKPGEKIKIVISRLGVEHAVELVLGSLVSYAVVPVEAPTPLQAVTLASYLSGGVESSSSHATVAV